MEVVAGQGSAGGEGGVICFNGESTGGAARVEVFGNGRLELVNPANPNLFHNAPGLTIGAEVPEVVRWVDDLHK